MNLFEPDEHKNFVGMDILGQPFETNRSSTFVTVTMKGYTSSFKAYKKNATVATKVSYIFLERSIPNFGFPS